MKWSVIIPALNEEEAIGSTLQDLVQNHSPEEILVADAGSTDRTAAIASRYARVIEAPRGRAKQMNEGVKRSDADAFLFLHADTKLPPGGLEDARQLLASGKARAGRFRLRFDSEDLSLKLYASYTRFPFFSYGDQGFFVTRELFEELNGYDENVPFEDIDFYRRLLKVTRPVILKKPVITSARRFLKVGKFRQKWINLLIVTLFFMGLDVKPLKEKVYKDVR